jgi:hypothetical protein
MGSDTNEVKARAGGERGMCGWCQQPRGDREKEQARFMEYQMSDFDCTIVGF